MYQHSLKHHITKNKKIIEKDVLNLNDFLSEYRQEVIV